MERKLKRELLLPFQKCQTYWEGLIFLRILRLVSGKKKSFVSAIRILSRGGAERKSSIYLSSAFIPQIYDRELEISSNYDHNKPQVGVKGKK